jgi:hypothetical protein
LAKHTSYPLAYSKLPLFIKVAFSVFIVLLLTYSIEILLYLLLTPQGGDKDMTFAFETVVKGMAYFLVANLMVSLILIALFELTRKESKIKWWHIILIIVICLPGSIAAKIVYTFLRTGFKGGEFIDFSFLSGLANYPSLLSAMLAYGLTIYWNVARTEHDNAIRAEALLKDARWQMLRYQVNPHFLFNSLNSIMAMINRDKDLARSMVNELASYFRYTLSWNDISVISLEEEISAVTHFLQIQKIRFEDKLEYSIEIEEAAANIKVPVFGLQTLVENAVKYGLKTHHGVVLIKVSVRKEDEVFTVSVSNTGTLWRNNDGDDEEKSLGTGTGLSNLKARLEIMYSGKAGLTISEENNRVDATIKIPAEQY